ncbi:3-hydroxyacyl-CoA dehydrogenase/enoyl-CoA hydratase family protein [Legionella londiniensis]|uniref:3-hydroxyacyl CoA dehydrogenase oxidoreductase n=1 Tax=Legionella londiniensis TaxID=45068 RepID=A0A0W0VME4_9GAMM|nr:3-hydroxyacyl-CoA dehydrogenase/enoyl-CoA hydratase family protein [Legionella londiniensis]KTD21256.1 3-hydroxyacyl CoA dehydrogenase oxidoreductase [Legionella londiniensis]STX93282.1 3-hydroxyacyl CoA dehydrogenase oxidoreductase [Legionella londiniensis]
MQEPFFIRKVAVLGAGVMGAQIAAHCLNAGLKTLLFDLAAKENGRNAIVEKAIQNLTKLKPAPLAETHLAAMLTPCNYEEDLAKLAECDLIIEAIAERLDWKQDLYQRISPHLHKNSILATNTSGLSVNQLAESLPDFMHKRFCGIHFFNPPRYMHLAELIPAKETDPALIDNIESWLTRYLGKGVVRAKDTPNFIANRIGVFSLLATLHHAEAMELDLDEVDALTGTLIGRPKSATFRTMDVVGLDTMQHVVHTMHEQLEEDPWHKAFQLPDWLTGLIDKGHLGQKTGQGIYRKREKDIEVYDIRLAEYRPFSGQVSDEVKEILKISDPKTRVQQLFESKHRQARFLTACFRDLFHYSAYHLLDIAETVQAVDLAMRWGFGWLSGPFETWQGAGVEWVKEYIQKAIYESQTMSQAQLPSWLEGLSHFYTAEGAFAPRSHEYKNHGTLPVYDRQLFPEYRHASRCPKQEILYENAGVCLWQVQDDIGVVNFKSKANTIGQDVLDGLMNSMDIAEKACQGLIIYQFDPQNFSSGADLRGVLELIRQKKWSALESMLQQFQQLALRLRYSPIPTIAALRGRALGGGCELLMHCGAVVAGFESYPGLVEAGVGLIPAGGGCKEMAYRAAIEARESDLILFLKPRYEQIATGFVAGSATEALARGYLRARDSWVMHQNEVLFAAISRIKDMQAANYLPPLSPRIKVAGREGHARLQAGLVNWLEGRFISEHDYFLANQLAFVICGGEVNQGEIVDESWFLKLEREAFMQLAETKETEARIAHLLETGKPLRN